MKTVFIWGAGKMSQIVYQAIRKDVCNIKGILDVDYKIQKTLWQGILTVYQPSVITEEEFNYVVVSVRDGGSIKEECLKWGIPDKKIVLFWEDDCFPDIIDYNIKKIALLEDMVERYRLMLENMPWELARDDERLEFCRKRLPVIHSSRDLLEKVIEEKCSLCRFGDGELEIMRGKERLWYQGVDEQLSKRLREVLAAEDPKIMIALADNFGNLECYTEGAAHSIRKYLSGCTRNELLDMVGTQREYYDAYVTRPYMMYKDKAHGEMIFRLFKKVWEKRSLLIVEGKHTRLGVNNDLFAGAQGIRRIICPARNAFDKYKDILEAVKNTVMENELVLIALGPTATVLAYDLAKSGVQALDIGQTDNEYEWFQSGAEFRTEIPGKAVAELSWCHNPYDIENEEYYGQIIKSIL